MAERRSIVSIDVEGEEHSTHPRRLDFISPIITPFLKINYVILAPWIILSLPTSALGRESILVSAASGSLLVLIVWGKVTADLYGLPGPDSAVLLLQFMLVIFLMEASTTALTVDSAIKPLEGKNDALSESARMRAMRWERVQLFNLGKLTVASFVLSLGLLILGSLVSISFNQIAFSGVLVLAAVVAIFVLLTYRREPEERRRSVE